MSKERNPLLYLDDILVACRKIEDYLDEAEEDDFTEDELVVDGVVRNLEIIGEAAGNIPKSFRKKQPEVEWRKLKEFRNVLAHEYFGVNLEIVKDLVENKLPEIKDRVEILLEEMESGG